MRRPQTGFERRRERVHRGRERNLRALQEAQRRALEDTRFWQFRKRKRIRREAEDVLREVANRFARYEGLLGRREAQMPFVRAFKGIHTQRGRYVLAQIARYRAEQRIKAEQDRAEAEADRLLAQMDAESSV